MEQISPTSQQQTVAVEHSLRDLTMQCSYGCKEVKDKPQHLQKPQIKMQVEKNKQITTHKKF